MGGAAKAVSQAAKVAPKAGPAGMQGLGRAMTPPPKGEAALQFMSDKLRGGAGPQSPAAPQMQGIGQAMRGQQANMPPPQGGMGGMAGMQGLGQAMGSMPQGSPAKLGQLGAAMGKTMGGMGMKSGGTASSRADGCATKGKTKGRFV